MTPKLGSPEVESARLNLHGAIKSIWDMFWSDPKQNRELKAIDPISVAFYAGVISCRSTQIPLTQEQRQDVTCLVSALMNYARSPDNDLPSRAARSKIADTAGRIFNV